MRAWCLGFWGESFGGLRDSHSAFIPPMKHSRVLLLGYSTGKRVATKLRVSFQVVGPSERSTLGAFSAPVSC